MAERARSLSDNARRMRSLLAGGAAAGHLASLTAVGVCLIAGGAGAGVSCALAAVGVLVFFIVGHAVQLRLADAEPRTILFGALGSYALRVVLLAVLLGYFLAHEGDFVWLDRGALFAGAATAVFGWLAGEIAAFRRLRIPVYDPPPAHRDADVLDNES